MTNRNIIFCITVVGFIAAGCVPGRREPQDAEEKYAATSLAAILLCRADKGLAEAGEAAAAWDRLMPNIYAHRFLSSPDGEEAIRILQMGQDENCDLDPERVDSVPTAEKLKLEQILNR